MKNTIFSLCLILICSSLNAQEWELVGETPFTKHHSNGFAYNGKAYVFQGTTSESGSNLVWEYDIANDIWTRIADFPGTPRGFAIGDDWEDKYYYGFGRNDNGGLNDLWVFDPIDTSYTQLPSCPGVGRAHPSLIAHNGKVFMGAGSSNNGDVNDWWEYDIATQIWTQKEDIPGPNRHHTYHFSIGNNVYVGGGHVNNWHCYNPETEVWTEIDDLPGGRVAGTQLQYGPFGLLLAGDDATHSHVPAQETFMKYDAELDEWEYLPPLPEGSRWACSSFISDGWLYFFGGISYILDEELTIWRFNLNSIGCLPASNLNAINVSDTSAGLFWAANDQSLADTLRWRKVGDPDWIIVPNPQAVYTLDGLEACQEYEFEVLSECNDFDAASNTYRFETDGCCINPSISVEDITGSSAFLSWPSVLAADEYVLQWREEGTADWEEAIVFDPNFELTDLSSCTRYECQLKTVCEIEDIDFSDSFSFLTSDCGACIDAVYCQPEGDFNGQFTFIERVKINEFENITGSDGGYANFVIPDAEMINIGGEFELVVEFGSSEGFTSSNIAVWIDLNANGDFEDDEKLVSELNVVEAFEQSINIPDSALPGLTRLRVMAFFGGAGFPCTQESNVVFGEAEDYCLNLSGVSSQNDLSIDGPNDLIIHPNPVHTNFIISSAEDMIFDAQILDVQGRVVSNIKNQQLNHEIRLPADLQDGLYVIKIKGEEFSQTLKFLKHN